MRLPGASAARHEGAVAGNAAHVAGGGLVGLSGARKMATPPRSRTALFLAPLTRRGPAAGCGWPAGSRCGGDEREGEPRPGRQGACWEALGSAGDHTWLVRHGLRAHQQRGHATATTTPEEGAGQVGVERPAGSRGLDGGARWPRTVSADAVDAAHVEVEEEAGEPAGSPQAASDSLRSGRPEGGRTSLHADRSAHGQVHQEPRWRGAGLVIPQDEEPQGRSVAHKKARINPGGRKRRRGRSPGALGPY